MINRRLHVVLWLLAAVSCCVGETSEKDAALAPTDPQQQDLITAAQQGDAGAQYLLGFMYAEGQSVPADMKEAVKWYSLAAAQGHPGVQLTLGMMYAEGDVLEKDTARAIQWYTKVAAQGNAGVQVILAEMLLEDQADENAMVKACQWLLLAEMNGKDVAERKAQLQSQMTDEQVAEATDSARRFVEQFPGAVAAACRIGSAAKYISQSDGFSIWMPSPPRRTVLEGGTRLLPVHYQSIAENGTQYNVSFQYSRSDTQSRHETDRKLLEDYLIGRAMYAPNQTIRKRYAMFKGYNAAQFVHTTRAGGVESVHEGIVFIVNGDFVSITCVYPSSLSPSPTFNEYANTFEFTLTQSGQAAQ